MKKSMMIVLLLTFCVLTGCVRETGTDLLEQEAVKIERALPEEYEKQLQTKTYLFQLSNGEGSVIDYYLCETEYYAIEPETVTGLNIYAFEAVFDVDNSTMILEFDTQGHPAAIFQGIECHYACCTVSPKSSVVMAYDQKYLRDETAVLIIRSIFEGAEVAEGYVP